MEIEITREDIRQLRTEAGTHGDEKMVATCDRALSGDKDAWETCEEAIASARARDDSEATTA